MHLVTLHFISIVLWDCGKVFHSEFYSTIDGFVIDVVWIELSMEKTTLEAIHPVGFVRQ